MFSEHMGDFIPDESWNFDMEDNSQEIFSIMPAPNVQIVRGMFQCDSES